MRLEVKRLDNGEGLPLPRYASAGAAGMDICAAEDTTLPGRQTTVVPTGFVMAVPIGYEIQVRPRSGLALNHGITIPNSPGTIDSDYRGEVKVIMHNLRDTAFRLKRGDRIAQLVVSPVQRTAVYEVNELDDTERGAGGFGSTGRN